MARHLKTRIQIGSSGVIDHYVTLLPAWQPTFVRFLRLYPGSFIVHFGDIFVAIIPLRHLVIPS